MRAKKALKIRFIDAVSCTFFSLRHRANAFYCRYSKSELRIHETYTRGLALIDVPSCSGFLPVEQ